MARTKIKVKYCGGIYGGFTFTTLTKDNVPTHARGGCKEYILDAVCCRYFSSLYASAYGLVDTDNLRLLCGNDRSGASLAWVDVFEKFIHEVETACSLEKTQVFEVEDSRGLFVFLADKRWLLAPPLLSLYATIPRCIVNSGSTSFDQVIEAMNKVYDVKQGDFIKLLMKEGFSMFGEDQKENWNHNAVHGYGIQSYLNGTLQRIRPDWYNKYKVPEKPQAVEQGRYFDVPYAPFPPLTAEWVKVVI